MAKVMIETINLEDYDFQCFLEDENIDVHAHAASPTVIYTGSRESLEKMIDVYFRFDEGDDYLKNFIMED